MRKISPVRDYMSTFPHSIGSGQTLAHAHAVMREHRIRHLPVLEGGVLVGLVSERDLHLIETLKDVDPDQVKVEEAMSSAVFSVGADAPLADVVETMARKKLGCAVVMRGPHVVGIFTTTDACHVLHALLAAAPRAPTRRRASTRPEGEATK